MSTRDHSAVSLWTKYALFGWNFLVWIVGLFFTGIGAYILVIKQKVVRDAIDFFFDPSTLMCTSGAVIVFITFLGWMGALREYTSFLRVYNWVVTLMLIGQLVLVVFVFIFYFVPDAKQKLGLFPEKTFQDAIAKYGMVNDDDMKNFIDNIQESLGCCGFSNTDEGFLDWNKNEYFNCTNFVKNSERCSVPPSCCIIKPNELKNILCGRGVMKFSNLTKVVSESDDHKPIYKQGCLQAVGNFINDHALKIGGVLIGILIPQMYTMHLARTLRYQILTQKAKWTQ